MTGTLITGVHMTDGWALIFAIELWLIACALWGIFFWRR